MALIEKGLPHTLEFIDILSGENYEPWFVEINPNCEVPVLKHGGKIVTGSQKIIDYLEDTFTQGLVLVYFLKYWFFYQRIWDTIGCVRLLPDRSSSLEYHKARYLRDAIDAVPVEFITYGYLRQPALLEKVKVPDFVRKGLGGTKCLRKFELL